MQRPVGVSCTFVFRAFAPFYPRALCLHTRASSSPAHTCVFDIVVVSLVCVGAALCLTTSLLHNLGIASETAPEWCMRSSDLRSASRRPSTHAASEDGVQHLCDTQASVLAHVVCTTLVSLMQLALFDTHARSCSLQNFSSQKSQKCTSPRKLTHLSKCRNAFCSNLKS